MMYNFDNILIEDNKSNDKFTIKSKNNVVKFNCVSLQINGKRWGFVYQTL